jgi:20S proteasome alpha/beta subunit
LFSLPALVLFKEKKNRMVRRRQNRGRDTDTGHISSARRVVVMRTFAWWWAATVSIHRIIPLVSASSSSSTSVSPVANWGPSWAASAAQGTTVVVAFDDGGGGSAPVADKDASPNDGVDVSDASAAADAPASVAVAVALDRTFLSPRGGSGCVVLLRSSSPTPGSSSDPAVGAPTPREPSASDGTAEETGAPGKSPLPLPLLQLVDTTHMVSDRVTRRWAWMPPAVLVAMTGLASDVDHLLSTLQNEWDSHAATYEGSDNALSPLRVTTVTLAQALYGAAQGAEGGRPYGVQCLVVGPMPSRGNGASAARKRPPFGLFTLDPGGGYRHWGVATAIGRGADRVRRNVYELLTATTGRPPGLPADASEALRVALNATASALGDDGKDCGSSAHYTALVLVHRGNGQEPLMAIVDPIHIQATVKQLALEREASRERGKAGGLAA